MLNLLTFFFIAYNRIFLRFKKGVTFNGKFRIVGPIRIDIRGNGRLVLGNNIHITSGLMFNPLGRNILSFIRIDEGAEIRIGDNAGLSNLSLRAKIKIIIGNNVKIGADTLILDSDIHSIDFLKRRNPETDSVNSKTAPVYIEDDAFIGTRCIITKGVTIGKRSVVAAGSVVNKSIPADEIWGGNPAQFIKKL